MSGFGAAVLPLGFSAGTGCWNGSSDSLEKIDMSLDDIIKLNRKEGRKQYSPNTKRGLQQNRAQQFRTSDSKWGIQEQKGHGKNRLGHRKKLAGRKRSYGVIAAVMKAVGSPKGISPLDRQPLRDKNALRSYPVVKKGKYLQSQSEMQRKQAPTLRRPAPLNRRNNMSSTFARIGNRLNQQNDARQATFMFRRGLKVQAQVQSAGDLDNQTVKRSRQWRTSSTSGGILTVSIDNPAAIITPMSQKLRLTRTSVPPFLRKRDQAEEKKTPKGVPLQFDINSVGKQTGMTLNERFGILKEQRTALSQNRGSRFVTVA